MCVLSINKELIGTQRWHLHNTWPTTNWHVLCEYIHTHTHIWVCLFVCVCVKWVTRSHRVRYYVMRYEFFALPVAAFNVSWIKSCSRVEPQRKRERERERKKGERLTKSGGERKRICVQAIKSSELRQPLMCICMHIHTHNQHTRTYIRLVMVQRSVWLLFRLIKRTQCAAK